MPRLFSSLFPTDTCLSRVSNIKGALRLSISIELNNKNALGNLLAFHEPAKQTRRSEFVTYSFLCTQSRGIWHASSIDAPATLRRFSTFTNINTCGIPYRFSRRIVRKATPTQPKPHNARLYTSHMKTLSNPKTKRSSREPLAYAVCHRKIRGASHGINVYKSALVSLL